MPEPEFTAAEVRSLLPSLSDKPDDVLTTTVWSNLGAEFTREGLAASSPFDAIVEWARTEFRRICRAGGDVGKKATEYLKDKETQHDAERLALVAGFLAAQFTGIHVELHAMVALAILLVRFNSKSS